jgi:heme/copper-type cytochrome/quinol oxidase subunit 2
MNSNTIGLELQRNSWSVIAIIAGIVLMIALSLLYEAMWRPREEESLKEQVQISGPRSFLIWFLGIFPWILILTFIVVIAYSITHILLAMVTPPNW